jgi:hypothetical protein
MAVDRRGVEPGVGHALAGQRAVACTGHALSDHRRRFAGRQGHQLRRRQRLHLDAQVDAVQQRARQPRAVTNDLIWLAAATAAGGWAHGGQAEVAAGAGTRWSFAVCPSGT